MEKERKKTLTISTNLKKKIDTSSLTSGKKKSFSVEKKKSFKSNKPFNKTSNYQDKNFKKELTEAFNLAKMVDENIEFADIMYREYLRNGYGSVIKLCGNKCVTITIKDSQGKICKNKYFIE